MGFGTHTIQCFSGQDSRNTKILYSTTAQSQLNQHSCSNYLQGTGKCLVTDWQVAFPSFWFDHSQESMCQYYSCASTCGHY